MSTLSEIVLGMLASLNSLEVQKNRLVEITADGEISDDELPDFIKIKKQLDQIDVTMESLKLWMANMVADGKINESLLNKLSN